MQHIPLMSAVMTPFPHSVDVSEALTAAADRMRGLGIRHLPVKDGPRLVGVISQRDVRVAMAAASGLPLVDDLTVRAACRLDVAQVDVHERLDDVLADMVERQHDCVLVLKAGRLAGIFTTTDACRGYRGLLRSLFPDGGDDAA